MAKVARRCPCLQAEEDDISVLDYCHFGLTDVPSEVFLYERTLEELYLDSNQIRDLPRALFHCHGLRKLGLSDNEIQSLPPAIASLINLEELDISKNGIVAFPDNIKGCKNLSIVEASINPLGKLPDGFTQLLNLEELYLNDTFLDFLPANFGRLSKLKILELRENRLKTLPKSMARLTSLIRLDIGQNEFRELPEVIGSLIKLEELWCDSNDINHIPSFLQNLKYLAYLDASNNSIEWFAPEVGNCIALCDVRISNNCLHELPDTIGQLQNLITLKVDSNYLVALPNTIGCLRNLEELVASQNDMRVIPNSIGLLRKLHTLYLDENCIAELPAELGSCIGLTILSVRDNQLTRIPDELGHILHLRVVNLSNNCIQNLPFNITKLREIQALWLSDNQTKPLIPLQSDYDARNGQCVLTCFMLPQQQNHVEKEASSDTESFQLSLWEEEREKKQHIKFAFDEELDQPGKLVRAPTPYPKELKAYAHHTKNQVMKLKTSADKPEKGSGKPSKHDRNFCRMAVPSVIAREEKIKIKEAKVAKPTSPNVQSKENAIEMQDSDPTKKNTTNFHLPQCNKEMDVFNNLHVKGDEKILSNVVKGFMNPEAHKELSFQNRISSDMGTPKFPNSLGKNWGDIETGYQSDYEIYANLRSSPKIERNGYFSDFEVLEKSKSYFPSKELNESRWQSNNQLKLFNREDSISGQQNLSSRIENASPSSKTIASKASMVPHVERKNSADSIHKPESSPIMEGRQKQLSSLPNAAHPNLIGIVQRSSPPPSPTHIKTLELVQKMRASTPPSVVSMNRMPSPPPSPQHVNPSPNANHFFPSNSPLVFRRSSPSPPRTEILPRGYHNANSMAMKGILTRSAPSSPVQNVKNQKMFPSPPSPSNLKSAPKKKALPSSFPVSTEKPLIVSNKLPPSPTRAAKMNKENLVLSTAAQYHNNNRIFPAGSSPVENAKYNMQGKPIGCIEPIVMQGTTTWEQNHLNNLETESFPNIVNSSNAIKPSYNVIMPTAMISKPSPPPFARTPMSYCIATTNSRSPGLDQNNMHVQRIDNDATFNQRFYTSPENNVGLPTADSRVNVENQWNALPPQLPRQHYANDNLHGHIPVQPIWNLAEKAKPLTCLRTNDKVNENAFPSGGFSPLPPYRCPPIYFPVDNAHNYQSADSNPLVVTTAQVAENYLPKYSSSPSSVSCWPHSTSQNSSRPSSYSSQASNPNDTAEATERSNKVDAYYPEENFHVFTAKPVLVDQASNGDINLPRSRSSSTGSNPPSKPNHPANFTQDKPCRSSGLPLVVPTPQRPLGLCINSTSSPRKSQWLFGKHRNPQVFPVVVLKNPGLGFSITGGVGRPGNSFKPHDDGIFVTEVQPNGPASTALKVGDKILEVNGMDFTRVDHEKALTILENCGPTASMMVSRD